MCCHIAKENVRTQIEPIMINRNLTPLSHVFTPLFAKIPVITSRVSFQLIAISSSISNPSPSHILTHPTEKVLTQICAYSYVFYRIAKSSHIIYALNTQQNSNVVTFSQPAH